MITICSKEPELKMAQLIAICKELNCKSASDVLKIIQSTYKNIGTEEEPKIIVEDVVVLTEVAWKIAHNCLKQQVPLEEIQDELSDFVKVQNIIAWATDKLIHVMNPPSAQESDPN